MDDKPVVLVDEINEVEIEIDNENESEVNVEEKTVIRGQPGEDGYSPTVSVSDITGGHRITITDADGSHSFDVMDGADGALYLTNIAISATTGDIASVSNIAISADHVLVSCVFANPGYIAGDVTWTTATGSLTLNGKCTAATTADVVLIEKDN